MSSYLTEYPKSKKEEDHSLARSSRIEEVKTGTQYSTKSWHGPIIPVFGHKQGKQGTEMQK
jgi:hypothetical protein